MARELEFQFQYTSVLSRTQWRIIRNKPSALISSSTSWTRHVGKGSVNRTIRRRRLQIFGMLVTVMTLDVTCHRILALARMTSLNGTSAMEPMTITNQNETILAKVLKIKEATVTDAGHNLYIQDF